MTGRATLPSWLLRLHKHHHFPEMLQRIPAAPSAAGRRYWSTGAANTAARNNNATN